MKLPFLSFITVLFFTNPLVAQVGFTIPDTVCAKELFTPQNNSGAATTYFWHFCSGNLSYAPSGVTLPADANLKGPAFMDVALDAGGYYALISNHGSLATASPQGLVLYRFGDSLLNNPDPEYLGNYGGIIPEHVEGVQLKKEGANWYGFVTGGIGDDSKLVRLNFGTSLENTPVVTDLGHFNHTLNYPVDLYLFEENGLWIGYTVNYPTGNLTRFTFNNGLSQPPTAVNIANLGLSNPCGLCPVFQDGTWYMFVTSLSGLVSPYITRLNFGSSLTNTPTAQSLGQHPALTSPFDIAIVKDCGQIFGFTINRLGSDMVRLDFPKGIDGEVVYTSLGNVGNLSNPHGLTDVYRVDNEIFTFVANADANTISRLYYPMCADPSVLTSTLRDPPPLFYNNPGNYNVSLILDQGLPTEKMMCKNIVVNPIPDISLPPDFSVCPQTRLFLEPGDSVYTSYLWSTNETTPSIYTRSMVLNDTVWVKVTNHKGCSVTDSVIIYKSPYYLSLGNDTSLTLGQPLIIDAGPGFQEYFWSTGEVNRQSVIISKPGGYAVSVTDVNNCIYSDTLFVTLDIEVLNFFTPNNDGYHDTWDPKLFFHFPEAYIKIYDRYGKFMVNYIAGDLPNGWDGTYNGRPVEPDTYWYVIDLKNGIKPLTGSITIKR